LDKDENYSLIFSYGVLTTIIGFAVAISLYPVIRKINVFSDYIGLIYFLSALCCVYYLVSEFLRGMEEISKFVIGNILLVVVTAISNILALWVLDMGIRGYLLSSCLGYIAAIIYSVIAGKEHLYLTKKVFNTASRKTLSAMIRYSVFLIPNTLLWWVTNASSRYFVLAFLGASYNGIYAVANKIPLLFTAITSVFIQAWQLSAIKEYDATDKNEYYSYVYERLAGVILILCSGIFVILKIFMHFYVPAAYFIAWQSSTFLIIASALSIVASFLGVNYVVAKNNLGNMLSTMVGAIVNVILNLLFIPEYGLVGAAFATFISYLLVVIYRIIDTRKYIRIKAIDTKIFGTFILILIQIGVLFYSNDIIYLPIVILFLLVILINKNLIDDIYKTLIGKLRTGV